MNHNIIWKAQWPLSNLKEIYTVAELQLMMGRTLIARLNESQQILLLGLGLFKEWFTG